MSVRQTIEPSRWVMSREYYSVARGEYKWSRCRFCGRAQEHDCKLAECQLCGSRVCHGNGSKCPICLYGWIPGWSRGPGIAEASQCGYAGCTKRAVANAPRVKRVCADHVGRVKIRWAGRSISLPDYVAECIAHRDSGKGWEQWRYVAAS